MPSGSHDYNFATVRPSVMALGFPTLLQEGLPRVRPRMDRLPLRPVRAEGRSTLSYFNLSPEKAIKKGRLQSRTSTASARRVANPVSRTHNSDGLSWKPLPYSAADLT